MKPHTKIKWGIVGLGQQAEKIADAIRKSRNGVLHAVASRDMTRAESFSARHGTPLFFDDYSVMLAYDVDAIFVASPNNRHKSETLAALDSGKHVLCEKPLALSLADGRAMVTAAVRNKRTLGAGFHLRFHPLMQSIRDLLQKNAIGVPMLIDMHWSTGIPGMTKRTPFAGHLRWRDDPRESGGGAIMARGVHLFDLLRFVTGDEVNCVNSRTDATPKDVDRFAAGMLTMKRGVIATIVTSRKIPFPKDELAVYGSQGRIIARNAFTPDFSGTLEIVRGKSTLKKTSKPGSAYVAEIEDFGDALLKQKSPLAGGGDGLAAIAITEAFIRSACGKKEAAVAKIK